MKQFTFRTILVAFALVIGSSGLKAAVGDVKTNVNIDFSNSITDNVVQGTVGSMSIGQHSTYLTEINGDGRLVLGNGTHKVLLSEKELAGTKDVVVISFDLAFGKLSEKSVGFSLLDASGSEIGTFSFIPYSGALTNSFGVETTDMYYGYNTVLWDRKVAFEITLDYAKKEIVTYTKCYKSGSGKAATENTHTVVMTNTNPLANFVLTSNYNNNDRRCQFDNLLIKTTEGDYSAASANYTLNYVNEYGAEVKSSAIKTGAVDDGIYLENADKASFNVDGDKYIYVSDDADGKTITSDGQTTVTITFRKAYVATVNVNTIINGESTVASTRFVEADDYSCSWSYSYPIYKSKDGVYFKADNIETFGETGTFADGDVIDRTVTYSNADPSIVFYSEESTVSGTGMTYSNGTKGYVAAQNKRDRGIFVGTLPAGVYTLEAEILAANSRGLVIRHSTDDPLTELTTTRNDNSTAGYKTSEFTLATNTESLFINGLNSGVEKTNQSEDFDYVIVRKLADLASVSSAGFATYSPTKNVVVPAEDVAEVYTASVSGNTVNLTAVPAGTALLAGTGYVVKAAEGSVRFDLTSDEASAIEGNDLKVAGEGGVEATGTTAYYVLAKRSNGKVGFTLVESGVVIPQGKAYLDLGTLSAKPAFIGIDGSTTAIQTLPSADADDAFYSLQGVKTAKPAKGIYINNGKKVVVKY